MSLCPDAYLSVTPNSSIPNHAVYIGTTDVPACSKAVGADCSVFGYRALNYVSDPYAKHGLCCSYRPSNVTYSISQQLSLVHCLSGDISARLVWSKVITDILAVAFGTKAAAMIHAWFCIRYYDGFPCGFPLSALDKMSWAGPLAYILISGEIAGFTFFLSYISPRTGPFGSGSSPASSIDSNFILRTVGFQNALHMIMVIRDFWRVIISKHRRCTA